MQKKRINKKEIKLRLKHDLLILLFSVIAAIFLVKTGMLKKILALTYGIWVFDSLIAGMFYTSGFTTAIAIVALSELSVNSYFLTVAFFGAIGAVIGDLIIFRFLRNHLNEDIVFLLKSNSLTKKLKAIFHLRLFRWASFLIGGIILASPLPDELGLVIIGLSKTKTWLFVLVSFTFNFIGILTIVLIAKAV